MTLRRRNSTSRTRGAIASPPGHRKNGDRCKRAAIQGGRVCTHHGGSAPAVKAKARQRLEDAADRMARELLKMATDDNVADSVKLAAIRDALDRAGLAAKTAVEVEVGPPKPYEVILERIEAGSRAEYRRNIGRPDDSDIEHNALGANRNQQKVKTVQAQLGHKTATMTLDQYGHLFPDDLDDVADKMDDLVSGCAQNVPTKDAGQGENML